MPEVYSAMDIYVLSSHDEGMSNALLEAMAMEKPVIATDVGGTGEVVDDGSTGILVPPRDWLALASALRALVANPAIWREFGRRGRAKVEQCFSASAMVRHMEQVYTALACQRGLLAGDARLAA